jgi:FAD/FMN-containing dehydrogenase
MAATSVLQSALAEWRTLLGEEAVLTGKQTADYSANTLGMTGTLVAVLRPPEERLVAPLIAIAQVKAIPLYPLSTGRNWGYGNALPSDPEAVVVDLSRLTEVLDFDADLGLVTVQPGVTQGMLADFLEERGAPFLVPVHGGGPHCSLLGNALERGYGITPYTDHFGAVTSLEGFLPDGMPYRSALTEMGAEEANKAHKWGLGPYLDGLFSQGGFGVITRATLALAPRPEAVSFFHFRVPTDAGMEGAVSAVRSLAGELEGVVGGVNLMNGRRVLSMIEEYPFREVAPGQTLENGEVNRRLRPYGAGPWTGVGALYGPRAVVRSARGHVRRILRRAGFRPGFWDASRMEAAQSALRLLPRQWSQGPRRRLDKLGETLRLLHGRPSGVALPLACWRTAAAPSAGADLDPAQGGCGLIWHAPLVPLRTDRAREYVGMVETTCLQYGIEPLITLTTLSPRCFDSTVPLLFDPAEPGAADRARKCQEALLAQGREKGFLPYRMDIRAMADVVDRDLPFWALVGRLKRAVDPHGIMAPGRYGPRG